MLLIALLVIFAVIRPALKALAPRTTPSSSADGQNAAANRLSATVENDVALPPPPGITESAAAIGRQQEIMKLAKENPATVANVVRTWVKSEA